MSHVITGASGQLARSVITEALERIEPSDLILVTRSPERLSYLAKLGAQVRHGDFSDPTSLTAAFLGGRRMLLISASEIGARIPQHQAAIDAAVSAGIEHIAYTSFVNPTVENAAAVVPEHRFTEEALRASGVSWTFLRNSVYADLQVTEMAAAAASGLLVTNDGAGKVAHVARTDCAAAAAAVLTEAGHAGAAYDITGPELLDAEDRAEIFAQVIGRTVEVLHVDDEAYSTGLAEATGMPIDTARSYATFGRAAREGQLEVVGSDFHELTGRGPMDLRSLLESTAPGT